MTTITEKQPTLKKPSPEDNISQHAIYFNLYPENITPDYLHNFLNYFPGNAYQKTFEQMGLTEQKPDSDEKMHSEKRKNQTLCEFYDTVIKTIKTCSLDIQEIESENQKTTNFKDQNKRMELIKKLIPVYLKLREIGYNHYDLVK